ncbi:MAG: hypothetical protein K1X42_06405 [Opitutaceae bacterium]|nr:hypothetical protein [Opitutaceae bacterium]
MNCWAQCLGGCTTKISREHIISKDYFGGQVISVSGFPWCNGKEVKVGLSSLVKKHLCTAHNSILSPLDSAAGDFIRVFGAMRAIRDNRARSPLRAFHPVQHQVNGTRLERWCLKTLINLTCDGGKLIGAGSHAPGVVPDYLVRICFGLDPWPKDRGLYVGMRLGYHLRMDESFEFLPIVYQIENRIVGGYFKLSGIPHYLSLMDEPFTSGPKRLFGMGPEIGDFDLSFHHQTITQNDGKEAVQEIVFNWI